MRVENDFVLASGSKFTWFLCRGSEINLILERGWKFTGFQRWGRNEHGFCGGDRNNLGFSVVIGIDLVLVWGSKLTWLLCGGQN